MTEFIEAIPATIFKVLLVFFAFVVFLALVPQISVSSCWMSITSQTNYLASLYGKQMIGEKMTITFDNCFASVNFVNTPLERSCNTAYKSWIIIYPKFNNVLLSLKEFLSKTPAACYSLDKPFVKTEMLTRPGTYCIGFTEENEKYRIHIEGGECKKETQ